MESLGLKLKSKSLSFQLFGPMVSIFAAVAICTVLLIHIGVQRNANRRLEQRAILATNSISNAAELITRTELQRFVAALGAEEEIRDIIVVGENPPVVIATNHRKFLHSRLHELADESAAEQLIECLNAGQSRTWYEDVEKRFIVTNQFPLMLSDGTSKAKIHKAAVLVTLNTQSTEAQIIRLSAQLVGSFLVAFALFTLSGYVLLRNKILNPVQSITRAEGSESVLRAASKISAGSRNEIGAMAELLHETILQLETQKSRFEKEATIDALTNILNRRSLDEQVEIQVSMARRYHQPFCLCVCDVDNFKQVNDTYGHLAGDKVLVRLASLLKSTVRTEDIVARLGGDEFCVVFPRMSADNAAAALERTRKEFSEIGIDADDGRRMEVSATFGVADFNSSTMSSAEDVFEAADRALYAAKEGGRNKVGTN